jgi:hypothetical protein
MAGWLLWMEVAMTRMMERVALVGLALGLGLGSIGCGKDSGKATEKDAPKSMSPQDMMEKARGGKKEKDAPGPKNLPKTKGGDSDK